MRLGITLPHMGKSANPAAVIGGAQTAERLGYDSIWTMDRLLSPVRPRNPYPGTPDDAPWPEYFKRPLDPIDSLTFAAAHTERIGLGTAVLDIPFYNPVLLGRRLATLDVLSGGRVRAGFGLGYSDDEYEAVGTSARVRGARAEEFLRLLPATWGPDPVEFDGTFFTLAPSVVGPKPVQQPRPPIYLAGYVPAALRRAARLTDGWMPNGYPLDELEEQIAVFRTFAVEAGRDPAELAIEVVGTVHLTAEPLGAGRRPYAGSADQIRADIARTREMGASELILELCLALTPADLFAEMEHLHELATS